MMSPTSRSGDDEKEMSRLKVQFDDDDQALLMLLSGELPAADAQALAQRLQDDVALRQRYAHLAETLDHYHGIFVAADAAEPLNSSPASAARQFAKAMRQAQADRLAMPARIVPSRRLMPTWAYPVSAAALLVVGFLVWWTYRTAAPPVDTVADNTPQVTAPTPAAPAPQPLVQDTNQNTPSPDADQPPDNADNDELAAAQIVVFGIDPSAERYRRGSSVSLDAAERDAAELDVLSSSVISDDSVQP